MIDGPVLKKSATLSSILTNHELICKKWDILENSKRSNTTFDTTINQFLVEFVVTNSHMIENTSKNNQPIPNHDFESRLINAYVYFTSVHHASYAISRHDQTPTFRLHHRRMMDSKQTAPSGRVTTKKWSARWLVSHTLEGVYPYNTYR